MERRHMRSNVRTRIWLGLIIFLHLKIDFQLDIAEAADILGIFPYLHTAGPLFVSPLVRVLVERGHKVTVISPENAPTDIEGVRHIRVPELNRHIRSKCRKQFVDFSLNCLIFKESLITCRNYGSGPLPSSLFFQMEKKHFGRLNARQHIDGSSD